MQNEKPYVHYLRSFRSTLGKQTATFFGAQTVNAGLGLVVVYILTAALLPEEWGRYQYLFSVFTVTMVFFDFGLNPAVKRLIAISGDDKEHELYGAAVLYSLGLGVMLALTLAVLSMIVDSGSGSSSGRPSVLLFMAPFATLYPLYELVVSVTQGRNSIKALSIATVLPRVLFIGIILGVGYYGNYSSGTALVLFLLAFGITAIALTAWLRPRFSGKRDSFSRIFVEVRQFGFNLYYGRVIDGMTNGFDKILIKEYHGLTPTGIYGLALALVLPVSMFSRAVAASAYKRFTSEEAISRKTLMFNTLGCILSGAAVVVGCYYIIPLLLPSYTASLAVLPYLAIGTTLSGLNTPYHVFLAAKRQGKSLRTMSFITSGLNLVLNFILVPYFSMIGAATAYIATFAVNLVLNLYYYRNYLANSQVESGNA